MKIYSLFLLLSSTLLLLECRTTPASETRATADPKAAAVAKEVMQAMGGEKAWENTRFLAWTFNNQYHLWDRKTNDLRYERGDSLVVISNLNTRKGQVYLHGTPLTDTTKANPLLRRMYPMWANNSYWFIMPYKLLDTGVTLKYIGEGQTQAGSPSDILQLTFAKVGVTPDNKYLVAVDKKSRLVTEWSYFAKYTDQKPAFTRPWSNYQRYGNILLSSGRSTDPNDRVNIRDIAVPAAVSPETFNSSKPINRSLLK